VVDIIIMMAGVPKDRSLAGRLKNLNGLLTGVNIMKMNNIQDMRSVLINSSKSLAGILIIALSFFLPSCCPPFCIGDCHSIPASDSIGPTAGLTIEYSDSSGQPQVEKITAERTITVSENQHFNIIYSGTDNIGIKYLWLKLSWTQWTGSVPQSVTPTVAPVDFGSSACSPRSASSRFTWQGGPRAYRFSVLAEDYHGNRGNSATLHVVHGTPPTPLNP
jgi:hypothetical protein